MSTSRAVKRRQQKLAKKAAKKAEKAANKAAFTHTAEEERTLDLAVEHHQAGRIAEAVAIYGKILATNPNHPVALHYMGLQAHQAGNFELAAEMIGKAVTVLPDYVEAHCNLANTLVLLDRAGEAEAHCRDALAIEPDKAFAHILLGKALRLQGRLDEAVTSCREALRLNPDAADGYEALASALSDMGQLDEAVENYQRAIALNPDVAVYHNNLADILRFTDRLEEAIEHFQKAVDLAPNQPLVHNNLGSACHLAGQYDRADESYRQATILNPGYVMAYQNRANVLRDMDRYEEAITCLETALTFEPNLGSLRHDLYALRGIKTDGAPKEYVENLFDHFANRFDFELLNRLEYKIPAEVKKVIDGLDHTREKFGHVVDLGCGTGLMGVELREIAGTLTGIDLSKNMVRKAERKGVYDALVVDDLVSGINSLEGEADLFVATDVFVYVGALEATFEAVRKKAADNALFAFSTEHIDSGDGFVLRNTSRYAHTKAYIEGLAEQFGFRLEHFEQTALRKEKSGWIDGAIYALRFCPS